MADVRRITRRWLAAQVDDLLDPDTAIDVAYRLLERLNTAHAAVLAGLVMGPDGHRYLSTYCAHALASGDEALHERCGAAQRGRGDDSPPHCKVGPAEYCICSCHVAKPSPIEILKPA